MKIIRALIITLCLGVIAFGGWKIYTIESGYHRGEKVYENLESFTVIPSAPKPTLSQTAEDTRPVEEDMQPIWTANFPKVDFDALLAINSQIVGWIYSEGTQIHYPIVQGQDNDYYLDHLFDNTPNGSGAIFLDCRNQPDFSDANSIVYGHNMKNGAMFAGLGNYKNQSYFEEHPQILLMTPEKNYIMRIFAAAVMGEWDSIWQRDFADEQERAEWLAGIMEKSVIAADVEPGPDACILTLSTCSYEYNGARFVVLGVLQEADPA